jgi:Protein of unknown function (DUF3306)
MSEKFLSRWSRRKREAGAVTSPREVDAPKRSEGAAGEGAFPQAGPVEGAPHPNPLPASRGEGAEAPASAPPPAFDAASLPSIESIAAGTDISVFLKPGVPVDLARAALRRAWVADPAIRDFVGLAENAWDFNAPGGVPGFEPLRAVDDVQRLAAQLMGATPAAASESPGAAADAAQVRKAQVPEVQVPEAQVPETAEQSSAPASPPDSAVAQPAGDAATQNDPATDAPNISSARRRHGGALAE